MENKKKGISLSFSFSDQRFNRIDILSLLSVSLGDETPVSACKAHG